MTNENRELELREKQMVEQEGTRPGPVFRPDVDILERSDAYVIHADLPGVDRESIEVHLDKGTLSLEARLAVAPDPSWQPVHTEYHLGGYHREFRVTDDIDVDAVTATMQDGVLELLLPKSKERQPRSIAVQAG